MRILSGPRPDLTAAQILSSGPVLAALSATAGVWTPRSRHDERLLRACVLWASALVLADAGLRFGRAMADRPVVSAAAGLEPPTGDLNAEVAEVDELAMVDDEDLEPLPPDAGDDDDSDEVRVDPHLTRAGEVDDAAGKPADFR